MRLAAQHGHELGALAGLGTQGLVRDDKGRSRRRRRHDAVQHLLRNDDAIERALCGARVGPDQFGVAAAVCVRPSLRLDNSTRMSLVQCDDGPAQARAGTPDRREHMRADRLVGIPDRNWDIENLLEAAPHIEPLRLAADEDRDRNECDLCLARLLRRPARLDSAALATSLAAATASSFDFALALKVSSCVSNSATFGNLLFRLLGPRLGLIRFGRREHLLSGGEFSIGARLEQFQLA